MAGFFPIFDSAMNLFNCEQIISLPSLLINLMALPEEGMLPSSFDGFFTFCHKVACHLKKKSGFVLFGTFQCLFFVAVLTQLK